MRRCPCAPLETWASTRRTSGDQSGDRAGTQLANHCGSHQIRFQRRCLHMWQPQLWGMRITPQIFQAAHLYPAGGKRQIWKGFVGVLDGSGADSVAPLSRLPQYNNTMSRGGIKRNSLQGSAMQNLYPSFRIIHSFGHFPPCKPIDISQFQ